MMELYLEGKEPTEEQLDRRDPSRHDRRQADPGAVRHRVQEQGRPAPARRGRRYLPSPLDVDAIEGHDVGDEDEVIERKPTEDEPFSGAGVQDHERPAPGQAHLHPGLLRPLETGTAVLNSTKGRKERIGKIYQMHANKREEIASVGAGHIVAVMGLKDTTTGETLCDRQAPGRSSSR